MTGYEMVDKALEQVQKVPKTKYTIGVWTMNNSVVTCQNCLARYEDDVANQWSDDWNYCPNCGKEIFKED